MSPHPSDAEIRRYRDRSLDPAQLLAVDDHLAACRDCRGRLAPDPEISFSLRTVRAELTSPHLAFEHLEAYAKDALKDAAAREHLELCLPCRAEAEDLRRFAGRLEPSRRFSLKDRKYLWLYGFGIAEAALMGFLLIPGRKVEPVSAPPVATAGKGQPRSEYAELIAAVIQSGKIDIPPRVARLAGHQHQLLGTAKETKFRISGPVGAATVSDQPEFRWEPLKGASSYRVSIYDSAYNPVIVSPDLAVTSWRSTVRFQRGQVYSWQVTATLSGQEITSPQPPAPEARFTPLSDAEAQKVERIRAKEPGAHLLLGILLGQAGAIEEAAAELKLAVEAGDHADDARKLLASLKL